jgi:hypothetical protein
MYMQDPQKVLSIPDLIGACLIPQSFEQYVSDGKAAEGHFYSVTIVVGRMCAVSAHALHAGTRQVVKAMICSDGFNMNDRSCKFVEYLAKKKEEVSLPEDTVGHKSSIDFVKKAYNSFYEVGVVAAWVSCR